MEKVLTATWDIPNSHTLAVYQAHGGYKSLRKALAMPPEKIVEEVKISNLRGRGGAGFPTGVKWGFLPKGSDAPRYLVINADEGEPGTFKDRPIMENDPHRLIEGCIITSIACGIETCYIYIRGEFRHVVGHIVEKAIDEAYKAGFLGRSVAGSKHKLEMYVHYGAGAYICGEETALLESIEGKPGLPRLKPPFPAVVGLFGCPTIINNVETITCVPTIIERGGTWFASMGNEGGGGPKLYCLAGHVERPGCYEARHDISLKELVYGEEYGGGVRGGKPLKAVVPGGTSCPVLKPDEIDVPMDFRSMMEAGSMLGTGGALVMDDTTCMVRMAERSAHFYHHESCGQCTPCREGSGWAERILTEVEAGRATQEDVDLLVDLCNNAEGNTICAHGDALAMSVRSMVLKFEEEFRRHVEHKGCPFPEW